MRCVYFPSCGSVDCDDFTMATEIPLYHEPVETLPTDPIDRVIRYHVQTKHHFNRYARRLVIWIGRISLIRFVGSKGRRSSVCRC